MLYAISILSCLLDTCSSKKKNKRHEREEESDGEAQKKKSKKRTEKVSLCLSEVICLHQ